VGGTPTTITGTVSFDTKRTAGYAAFTRSVVFKATNSGGSTTLATWTVSVRFSNNATTHIASGTYTLTGVPAATYTISAKDNWTLRRRVVVTGPTVDFTGANILLAGDINVAAPPHNNAVNIADYNYLISKWGTTDAAANVNGDTAVNVTDYNVLIANWGMGGDPM